MRLSSEEVNVGERKMVPKMGWVARFYLWACERLYHELAWGYDRVSWVVSGGRWRGWQAGVWDEVRGRDLLEMGSGTGELLVQGWQRRMSIVGVDRSPAMLAVARSRAHRMQASINMLQGDGRILPFGDEVFDTVLATFPAGYIIEPTALVEMQRVLRPGGRVVLLGLWVELRIGSIGRRLPLFYGRPSQAALAAMLRRVTAAGFAARWVEQHDGYFTVGVLVADRT